MQKVKFTNAMGESVHLGIEHPFILQSISGTGEVDVDVKTIKTPLQDGQIYNKTIVGMRDISMQVTILSNDERTLFERRKLLSKVFNPKLGQGVLEYITANGTKKIKAAVDGAPSFKYFDANTVTALINLLCPSPYWTDMQQQEHLFETPYTGLFEFPFFLTEEGFSFGEEKEVRIFINNGDVPTPLHLQFEGGVKNVELVNLTTGSFIKIDKMIDSNKVVLIDSTQGSKEVSLVAFNGKKQNALGLLSLDSSFLELAVGENLIRYTAINNEGTNSHLRLRWDNRYIGL